MAKAREGESTRGGLFPLLLGGGGGVGVSPKIFLIFSASMCVFNVCFYAFGNRFQSRFFA